MAGLYLTLGLLAIVGRLGVDVGLLAPLPNLRWLTVHLVTIGGLTEALFGALPHLVAVVGDGELATGSRRRWVEWVTLNAGYPLVLLGMVGGSMPTAIAGATLVLVALVLLGVEVSRVEAAGGLGRFYRTAPWFLGVGILMALSMLTAVLGPAGYFGTKEAHVHANVWGFLALVAAGTLLAVSRSLASDRDAESTGRDAQNTRQCSRYERVAYLGITVGATGLVVGPWVGSNAITFGGLGVYLVGTVALLATVVGAWRGTGRGRDSRLGHVLGAYLWLAFPVPWAPFVLLVHGVLPGGAIERAAVTGLVFGWMLQLAMAFLPAVVGAIDDAPMRLDALVSSEGAPSWWSVAAVNVGLLALWLPAFPPFAGFADGLRLAGYGLLVLPWAGFLVRLWRAVVDGDRSRGGSGVVESGVTATD